MTHLDEFLSRLEAVRNAGKHQWVARCPAHEDRSPSLSIHANAEGCIAIHCHAGCGANQVLDAVGMEYSDLYPPQDRVRYEGVQQRRFNEKQARYESFLMVMDGMRKRGERLSPEDVKAEREAFHFLVKIGETQVLKQLGY